MLFGIAASGLPHTPQARQLERSTITVLCAVAVQNGKKSLMLQSGDCTQTVHLKMIFIHSSREMLSSSCRVPRFCLLGSAHSVGMLLFLQESPRNPRERFWRLSRVLALWGGFQSGRIRSPCCFCFSVERRFWRPPPPSPSLTTTPAPQTACALELQCWAEGLFSECLFVFCREAGINYHDHMLDNAEAYGMPASSLSIFIYLFYIFCFLSNNRFCS